MRGRDHPPPPAPVRGAARGVTVVELAIAIALVCILTGLATTSYGNYRNKARASDAVSEISRMGLELERRWLDERSYPETLEEVFPGAKDPWGRPYGYLRLDGRSRGKARKDHSLVPINTRFDLYSMGPDGRSVGPLTAKASRDDIIWARDGDFVGPAEKF